MNNLNTEQQKESEILTTENICLGLKHTNNKYQTKKKDFHSKMRQQPLDWTATVIQRRQTSANGTSINVLSVKTLAYKANI